MIKDSITSGQLRAARLFLNITQNELAIMCDMSIMTIRRAEKDISKITDLVKSRLIEVLSKEGIQFTFPQKNSFGVVLEVKSKK